MSTAPCVVRSVTLYDRIAFASRRNLLAETRMDTRLSTPVARRFIALCSRRAALPVLAGSMLAIPGWAPLAARKRRKRKKKTFCLEGDTIKSRNKKKKKRLRKQGATRGACPACPDIQGVDELAAAIAAAVPGTTLRLCPGTFQLSSSLVADLSLTLIGAGTDLTILDGGDTVRVLRVGSVDVVTLRDLTITRGRAPASEDRGGGILNQGELALRGVAVTNCSAELGGGIFSQIGTLRLEAGTRIAENAAQTGGGISRRVER